MAGRVPINGSAARLARPPRPRWKCQQPAGAAAVPHEGLSPISNREIEAAIFDAVRESAAAGTLRDELHGVVDDVQTAWLSAWDASGPHPDETGSYRDSIRSEKRAIRLRRRGSTPVGSVSSDDEQAAFIEYGTEDTEEFAPARKAALEVSQ